MTEPDDRYHEEMRRALSAAADLVVPAGDGLEKIRGRVMHRPALFAWFVAYTQDLPHRIFVSFRVAATSLTAHSGSTPGGSPGAAPPPPDGRKPRFNRDSSWLRPTLAAVGSLAIVAIAATVVLPRLTQPVSTSALQGSQTGQNSSSAGGTSSNPSTQQNSSGVLPITSTPPHSAITMLPTPTQCVTVTPSTSYNPSPSPTDTTPSTYISPSPAPGPSDTATPTPGAGSEDFVTMIGEEPVQAEDQRAAATVTCASQVPTSEPATSPPPTSPPPTSPPPTSPPPTSPPPTSPPPTSPPPTSPPPSTPVPQGSGTPTQAPPAPAP